MGAMTSCSGLGEAITPEGTECDENFNAIVSTVDSYVVRMGDSTDSSGNVRRAYSLRQIASSQRFSGFRAVFHPPLDLYSAIPVFYCIRTVPKGPEGLPPAGKLMSTEILTSWTDSE